MELTHDVGRNPLRNYPNKVRQIEVLLCARFVQSLRSCFRSKNTQSKPPLCTAICVDQYRSLVTSNRNRIWKVENLKSFMLPL